jgi:hypothetical protein
VFVAAVSLFAVDGSFVGAWSVQQAEDSTCPVTLPGNQGGLYGNDKLSVGPFGLWPNGTVTFRPGGPGFVTSDGALGMKFGWTRGVDGKLKATGRRLDGDAPPLRLHAPDGYGTSGFQASYLIFPTPGCWEVNAQVGEREDSRITFITNVVKIGQGPSWRLDP